MGQQYITKSSSETKRLAEKMAKKILRTIPKKRAVVLSLEGDLGGGKTTFIQGLAKGLGIKEKILSPTFVIMRKFQMSKSKCQIKPKCQNPKFKYFYHFDCYRIQNPRELITLNFKEIIKNPQNIIAIEWADRIKKIIPQNTFWLKFEIIDDKTRKIIIKT